MVTKEILGIRFGGGTFLGTIDGEPRLIIPRQGVEISTTDADGVTTFHDSVIANTANIAFDSAWPAAAVILAEGVATPSTSSTITVGSWTFWTLATWADPGYVPIPMVFDHNGIFGPTSDARWGYDLDASPIPGTESIVPNVLHTAVNRTTLAVAQGNLYNNVTRPARSLQYVIFGMPAL